MGTGTEHASFGSDPARLGTEADPPARMDVEAFIKENVRPEDRETVTALREILRDAAPSATLGMHYGLPMWKGRGYLAYLSPSQRGITFGFPHGVSFDDPRGLLRGKAKHARHLKYARTSDIDEDALRFYVAQAIAQDSV